MKKRKNERTNAALQLSSAAPYFIHQSQLLFFYGASEFILGRCADMPSMCGIRIRIPHLFLLLLLFLLVALELGTAGHTALHQRPGHRRGQRLHYSDGGSDGHGDGRDGVWIDTW
jgi:hypothetical protein